MTDLPPILTVKDVASVLRVTDETVCAYIRRGDLRASGLGTTRDGAPCAPYAIRREDLSEFLDRRSMAPCEQAPVRRTAARTERSPRTRRRKIALVSPVGAT